MSKEMNKLLKETLKFDVGSGLLISLLIVLLSGFTSAIIYLIGICVSLCNFIGNVYVMSRLTSSTKNKSAVISFLVTFLRLGLVIICAVPFADDVKKITFYVTGFISHYLVLISYCLISRKGSV
ncbi:MAG: hypothetical protein Q4F66_03625 [Clostridium sp.]|nr:hypothetical protein [Clostridium sp.]